GLTAYDSHAAEERASVPRLISSGFRAVRQWGRGPMLLRPTARNRKRSPARRLAIWLLVALIAFLFPSEAIAETKPPAAAAESVLYQFEETVWVTNVGSTTAQRVRLEVPLMATVSSPGQDVIDIQYNVKPEEIRT